MICYVASGNRTMNRIVSLLISLLPLLLIEAAAAEPYKIGVIYGFSGAAQKWADYGRKGIDLAADEVNQAGGIDGRPVNIIYEDNQTDPKQSVSAYRKLVSNNKVDAIIASNWSILTNPLIPLSAQDKVVVLSPTVMDASVQGKSDYFFTLGHKIESVREPLKQFLNLNKSIRRAAFLCWDDAWGQANLRIWEEEAKAKSVKVVATLCQNDYGSDFRSEVTRISALKPDVVFVGMYPERVASRMKELGLNLPIFTTSVVLEPMRDPGFPAELFDNMYFAYWPSSDSFREKYITRYGEEPLIEVENHYEAVRSLAKAFGGGSGTLLTKLKRISYEGVTGRIDFRDSFVANHSGGSLMQVRDRIIEVVK
ncbi:MAG: amino acid ABC transporter substrate-binding protein [Proteobacteria bacterium]|nr:amino acid ABC transporter substrate-binding protein [Pseudomonadota bacterium]